VQRRLRLGEQALEQQAPLRHRLGHHARAVHGEEIEGHEGRRRLARELRHARGGGVKPHLQRVEVETRGAGDHDLAVDHATLREAIEEQLVQVGEVAVERAQVAALDEDLVLAAKHDGAEAVPLGLIEVATLRRNDLGDLREHRLHRRHDCDRVGSRGHVGRTPRSL
jgi:hypothetical protein